PPRGWTPGGPGGLHRRSGGLGARNRLCDGGRVAPANVRGARGAARAAVRRAWEPRHRAEDKAGGLEGGAKAAGARRAPGFGLDGGWKSAGRVQGRMARCGATAPGELLEGHGGPGPRRPVPVATPAWTPRISDRSRD